MRINLSSIKKFKTPDYINTFYTISTSNLK